MKFSPWVNSLCNLIGPFCCFSHQHLEFFINGSCPLPQVSGYLYVCGGGVLFQHVQQVCDTRLTGVVQRHLNNENQQLSLMSVSPHSITKLSLRRVIKRCLIACTWHPSHAHQGKLRKLCVQIKDYSITYFNCMKAFKILYYWTSLRVGGAHTCYVDTNTI